MDPSRPPAPNGPPPGPYFNPHNGMPPPPMLHGPPPGMAPPAFRPPPHMMQPPHFPQHFAPGYGAMHPPGMPYGMPPPQAPRGFAAAPGGGGGPAPNSRAPAATGTATATASSSSASLTAGVKDPLNDAASWSEHTSDEDGRRYWHNAVTGTSTYEKPNCLKSPEERSIPPCAWKEFVVVEMLAAEAPDGKAVVKRYYNNGSESVWTVPAEFTEWKEKVAAAEARAAERKKANLAAAAGGSPLATSAQPSSGSNGSAPAAKTSASLAAPAAASASATAAPAPAPAAAPVVIKYATPEAAAEAFSSLLSDNNVSATAKLKDVTEQCSADPRWGAMRTVGEKKQALAEYQTRKLKADREAVKTKAKRARDRFFALLAEQTAIDERCTWRTAVPLLSEDPRFRDVESDADKQDYFAEFVSELASKSRRDAEKARSAAEEAFSRALEACAAEGTVSRKTAFTDALIAAAASLGATVAGKDGGRDSRDAAVKAIVQCAAIKAGRLGERDLRKVFDTFVSDMRAKEAQREKERREAVERELAQAADAFAAMVQGRIGDGSITREHRSWRALTTEAAEGASLTETPEYKTLVALSESRPRVVFEDTVDAWLARWEEQKRAVGAVLQTDGHFIAAPAADTADTSGAVAASFAAMLGVLQAAVSKAGVSDGQTKVTPSAATAAGYSAPCVEKVAELLQQHAKTAASTDAAPRKSQPSTLQQVHEHYCTAAMQRLADDVAHLHRCQEDFADLLGDLYYRSDHIGGSYSSARRELQRHRAYERLQWAWEDRHGAPEADREGGRGGGGAAKKGTGAAAVDICQLMYRNHMDVLKAKFDSKRDELKAAAVDRASAVAAKKAAVATVSSQAAMLLKAVGAASRSTASSSTETRKRTAPASTGAPIAAAKAVSVAEKEEGEEEEEGEVQEAEGEVEAAPKRARTGSASDPASTSTSSRSTRGRRK